MVVELRERPTVVLELRRQKRQKRPTVVVELRRRKRQKRQKRHLLHLQLAASTERTPWQPCNRRSGKASEYWDQRSRPSKPHRCRFSKWVQQSHSIGRNCRANPFSV